LGYVFGTGTLRLSDRKNSTWRPRIAERDLRYGMKYRSDERKSNDADAQRNDLNPVTAI